MTTAIALPGQRPMSIALPAGNQIPTQATTSSSMAPPTIAQRRQSAAIAIPNNGGPSNREIKPMTDASSQSKSIPPSMDVSEARSASPEGEDEDAEGEDEDDDVGNTKKGRGRKRKGGAMAAMNGVAGGAAAELAGKPDYKYTAEISQMMFVFGEVQDPLPETVRLVEDIVRGQIIEIVTRARLLTHLRSSRFLSAEDLIFLIRDDRGKVNRLRTYLSWKDVRKKAKEDEDREGNVDVDIDEANDKAATKARKPIVKLPWELLTPFSDFLRSLPTSQNRAGDEDEEEDEDEMQAHQDSLQRLRDADEITKKMSKDEYVHYSDCRQASFTYRKARRFREFINFQAYLDVRPNDDIIDILGFLSFEMVRSLCVTALEVREQLEKSAPSHFVRITTNHSRLPTLTVPSAQVAAASNSPAKRKSISIHTPVEVVSSPSKKLKPDISTPDTTQTPVASHHSPPKRSHTISHSAPVPLFAPPPSARQPLEPHHVLEAFAQIQREQASSRVGGMRNFKGGLGKGRIALV